MNYKMNYSVISEFITEKNESLFAIVADDFHKGFAPPYHENAISAKSDGSRNPDLSRLEWKPAKFPKRFRYIGQFTFGKEQTSYHLWKELAEC